jgi:hypothetical protein
LSLRFNSTLSAYNKTRRFIREHTRAAAAIAATTAVAGLGAAGAASAVAGPAPLAQAATTAAAASYGTPAGHASASLADSVTSQHPASAQMPSKPYDIYDSISPSSVPAGQPVATYADGPYTASSSQVTGHGKVLWIDTNGSDPKASALDVEPGDATPAAAAQWVQQKLTAQHSTTAIVYTMQSEWPQVKAAINTLPSNVQSHVKYWVADPTGTPHMVPGASATQWYWGNSYDISTAQPGF